MEDELVILGFGPRLLVNEDYFAVYDGHGGDETSKYLANNLHKQIARDLVTFENPVDAIHHAFITINDIIINKKKISSGSTAGIAFVKNDMIYFANCGDTRAVLCRGNVAERVSVDHKPDLEEEKLRIEALDGFVVSILGVARVNAKLAVSRAFGDLELHPLVTSTPYIKTVQLTEEMNFFILACDGLWDMISDEESVEIVKNCNSPHEAAEQLTIASLNRYSTDNITVVVVFLKEKENWTF